MADPPTDGAPLTGVVRTWTEAFFKAQGWSFDNQSDDELDPNIDTGLVAKLDQALSKLEEKIAAARDARPDKRAVIASLLGALSELAAKGDEAGLTKRLKALGPALDKLIASKAEETARSPFSVRALGKVRIEWIGAREAARNDIKRLKAAIREAYASYPMARSRVERDLTKLDTILDNLNAELADRLDNVLTAENPSAQKTAVASAQKTVQAFRTYAETDSIAQAVDRTAFLKGVKIMTPLRQKLVEIEAAIASAG